MASRPPEGKSHDPFDTSTQLLAALRIVASVLFLSHGLVKPFGPISF
jgi:hypothetical protein